MHLFSFSLDTKRLYTIVGKLGLSFTSYGVGIHTPSLSFCWLWPWKRKVKSHPYMDTYGTYYRTIRELKKGQNEPNVIIKNDKYYRIN